MRRFPILVLICVLAALGLAACGGDDDGGSSTTDTAATETTDTTTTGAAGGGGETVQVAADPSGALAFEQKSLSAPAGSDTFEFTNESSTPHDFVVEDEGGKELGKTDVIDGGKDTVKLDLAAGKYTYFCSVPGHRQAGMEGPLTVK
jgi:plastocyanin